MPTKILIIDDNRDTLKSYTKALLRRLKLGEIGQSILEKESYRIEVEDADSVQMALKKLRAEMFDIMVVDLKIPGSLGEEMGGLELISESIRLNPLRPIIVITGYGSIELARKTLTQGVYDFIEKSSTAVEELIIAVQKAIDYSDEKKLRAGNPFTPMAAVEPTIFGGRAKELEFFEQKLSRAMNLSYCEHFLVLGKWGIGKSTLLKEYKRICQSRGYITSIVPLEPLQTTTTLLASVQSLVEGIFRDLPYPVNQFKRVANFFDSVGVNVLGTGLQFKRDTSRRDISPQAFLHDTLLTLWQDLESKTDAVIILLDDLDNFMTVPEIVMTLRQTLSMDSIRKTNIIIGMASTPESWRALTSISQHHPLSRYFLSRVELEPLTEAEMRETIIRSLSNAGVSFSAEVLARVFEYTEGHPYEMQVLCYHLFSNQLLRKVDATVWDKSLQATLGDLGVAFFDYWLNQASAEEAKVIQTLAKAEAPISVKDICKTAETNQAKMSTGNIAKYLQRLVEKKLIIKTGRGLYNLPDKMFRAYICSLQN